MTRTILSIAPGALGAVTASRGSTATEIDQNGVVQSAAINAVRVDHYEQGVRTILLEGSGTSGWTQPDGSLWVVERTTKTANALTAPDGTMTATQYLETAVSNTNFDCYRTAPSTPTDNTTQAVSVFAKPIGRRYMQFKLRPKTGSAADLVAVFDTQTGTWARRDAGLTAAASALLANSWRRYTFAYNSGSSTTASCLIVVTAQDSATPWSSYNGDVTKGYAIRGDQWELDKPFCSSFMPSGSRSPDLIGWTIPDAPHAMEWRVSALSHGQHAVAGLGVAYLGNDAATGARVWIESTGTGYQLVHHNGTTQVTSAIATSPAAGARVDFRAELYADGSVELFLAVAGAAEIAGNKSAANPFAPAWGGQTFRLNSRGTGSQGNAAYISATLTDLHVPQPSVSWTDAQGAATLPLQVRAFEQWVPMTNSVADRETGLGTGATFEYQYRVDYGAAFRMPYLVPSQLDLCARLKLQLLSGGQVTVFTDDTGYRSYTCTLWPGADVPDPELTDRQLLFYTQALQVRNTQAAPMVCDYRGTP